MSKKHFVSCLTGLFCLALAAALALGVGCSKSGRNPAPENPAPENPAAETPAAGEADAPQLPAEPAADNAELPGADGKIKVVEPGTSFDKVVQSAKVVVVDFNATWCGPCRKLGPYLERMAESYKEDGVSFFSVDIDQHRDLVEQLDIPSIPDVRIYLNGSPVDKVVGCEPIDLMEKIDAALKNAQ